MERHMHLNGGGWHWYSKYLGIDWSGRPRPDGRRFRFRHLRRVHSLYLQVGRLEIGAWYR